MQHGGFLDKPRTNPVGLGLVVAGHVAVLAAIALAPPEMVPRIEYFRSIVDSIKEPPPPKAETPPPPARAEPRSQPTTTERIVDVDPIIGPTVPLLPPVPDIGPVAPIQPAKADPVFLPATIDPSAMGRFQPDYPPELIRADIEGTATVRVLVGTDGRVKAVELVSATQPGFFDATKKQALRYWRFKPATNDGIAAESWRVMTVRFKIQS